MRPSSGRNSNKGSVNPGIAAKFLANARWRPQMEFETSPGEIQKCSSIFLRTVLRKKHASPNEILEGVLTPWIQGVAREGGAETRLSSLASLPGANFKIHDSFPCNSARQNSWTIVPWAETKTICPKTAGWSLQLPSSNFLGKF